MQQTSPQINWLLERGISQAVLDTAKVYFNGSKIVIPIFDRDGNFLFNKYRRDPMSNDETIPKYMYEKGSTAALYNAHTVKDMKGETIFILEGELEVLLFNSMGLKAVSSTGGAGTFHPEWLLDFCNNDIYIIYDKDDAGIKGSMRVNALLPHAKTIFLPETFKGKDMTDYFKKHTIRDFEALVAGAQSIVLPTDAIKTPDKKTQIHTIISAYSKEIEKLLDKKREETYLMRPTRHIEIMIEIIQDRINLWKKRKDSFGKVVSERYIDRTTQAKQVPISNYLEFNSGGFHKCLWHEGDNTPSLKYREERNRVFCHGCRAHKDTIDVVMALRGVDFNSALNMILGNSL